MDSQIEVRNLFDKLRSWREESQKEFSSIIINHSSSINKGVNSLVEEVCDLKAKLSILTTERNDLLETVDNLRGEVQGLAAKLQTVQHFQEPKRSIDQDTKVVDTLKVEILETEEWTRINKECGEEVCMDYEDDDFTEFMVGETDYFEDCTSNEWADAHVNKTEQVSQDEDMTKNKHKKIRDYSCDKCSYTVSQKVHLNNHKESVHKTRLRMFKCEVCSYASVHKYSVKIHTEAVHDKIKNHTCGECGYATTQACHLKRHKEAKHKI